MTVNIIVHLKAQLSELLNDFNGVIKEQKNIVGAVFYKKLLGKCMQVLLEIQKCPVVNVHNKLGLMKLQHDLF